VLLECGEQLELVAAEPHGDPTALQVGSAFDARRLEGDLAHATIGEHLGDIDERRALVPGR
jgi:hypothetical protein